MTKRLRKHVLKLIKNIICRVRFDLFVYFQSVVIVRKGCSKGTGIKIIKDHYRLEKIAGIGDSYNDLPMLNVVDTAFTFKTSPQEIKKQVHYCVNDIAEAIALLEVEK